MRGLKQTNKKLESGFTIVETIIASAIFSLVMLVALSGFIEIGRLFYKGSVYTLNQQTSRNIVDQVSSDIHATTAVDGPHTTGGDKRYYCIGNARYTFTLGRQFNALSANRTDSFGVLRDQLDGSNGCANPLDSDSPGYVPISSEAAEMLSDKMRVNFFCIEKNVSIPGHLYDVGLDVTTGGSNAVTLEDQALGDCGADKIAKCNGNLAASQFCAENDLETSVSAFSNQVVTDTTGGVTYMLNIGVQAYAAGDYVSGSGLDCGSPRGSQAHDKCSHDFPIGTTVSLTSHTGHGSKLSSWSDNCQVSNNVCSVTIFDDTNVTATFIRR